MNGQQLFEIVRAYHSLGIHRTGTAVDNVTVAWMADQLRSRGCDVTIEPVSYQQWTYSSELVVDGEPMEHLPVFHEWTGRLHTTNVHRVRRDIGHGGHSGALAESIADARSNDAEAVIIATEHPNGSLIAVNRVLGDRSDYPTLLVAGRDGQRLLGATTVELTYAAQLVDGHTANIIGTRSGTSGGRQPVLLTTPLTGWFGCAGERGTGIAVLLDLIDRMDAYDLMVVPTGGHELTWFGAQRWVDDLNGTQPMSAIVHVGASVAVVEPGTSDLIATRLALTSLTDEAAQPVTAALETIGLNLVTGCEQWIGEGQTFSQVGAPLLSFSGAGVDFHTPEDTPERATTPAALHAAATAIGDAVEAFLAAL